MAYYKMWRGKVKLRQAFMQLSAKQQEGTKG